MRRKDALSDDAAASFGKAMEDTATSSLAHQLLSNHSGLATLRLFANGYPTHRMQCHTRSTSQARHECQFSFCLNVGKLSESTACYLWSTTGSLHPTEADLAP